MARYLNGNLRPFKECLVKIEEITNPNPPNKPHTKTWIENTEKMPKYPKWAA